MKKSEITTKIYIVLLINFLFLFYGCKSLDKIQTISLDSEYKCEPIKETIRSNEWDVFRAHYTENYFNILSASDTKILESSTESKSWNLFNAAISTLQENKDRVTASILFKKVYLEYPETFYANQSKELSELLTKMIIEDNNWKEPANIDKLSINEQIKYHIYHIRNIASYQDGNGIVWSVFNTDKNEYNAAKSLEKIGKPAIPYLINLLDDRRPTCTIAYFRDFHPTRIVFRYQDAAIEILNAITKKNSYSGSCTACYFSTENCETRKEKWKIIKNWYYNKNNNLK